MNTQIHSAGQGLRDAMLRKRQLHTPKPAADKRAYLLIKNLLPTIRSLAKGDKDAGVRKTAQKIIQSQLLPL